MLKEEFEKRTGFHPCQSLYAVIEEHYMKSGSDKDVFCRAYKEDKDGLATKIQREADMRDIKDQETAEKTVEEYKARIAGLEEALEREQEWKPYEDKDNVQQDDYAVLAAQPDTKLLSDEQAKQLLYDWYGFAKEKVEILHSVPVYEVNRHRKLRKVGELKRIPLYNATDWNYIRFDCSRVCYELFNDNLRLFAW